MCHLCGWLKLFLKKCGGKKNKKHRVGLSVGLLAVQLQYGLCVFGHLSKWFVFVLVFKIWSVSRLWNGRPTIGYNLLIEAVCSSKYNNFRCICAGSGAQISERVITVYFSLNCREMFNLHTKVAGIFDIKTAHF